MGCIFISKERTLYGASCMYKPMCAICKHNAEHFFLFFSIYYYICVECSASMQYYYMLYAADEWWWWFQNHVKVHEILNIFHIVLHAYIYIDIHIYIIYIICICDNPEMRASKHKWKQNTYTQGTLTHFGWLSACFGARICICIYICVSVHTTYYMNAWECIIMIITAILTITTRCVSVSEQEIGTNCHEAAR